MSLFSYPVTALALSDAQGTNGQNIVVGASITLVDTSGNPVVMFDDAIATNGNTLKTTGADGTKDIFVDSGAYVITVNGASRNITVAGALAGGAGGSANGILYTEIGLSLSDQGRAPRYSPGGIEFRRYENKGISSWIKRRLKNGFTYL